MRRSTMVLFTLAGVLACDDPSRPTAPGAVEPSAMVSEDGSLVDVEEDGTIPGHFIVAVAWESDASALAAEYGLQPKHVYEHLLNGFAGAVPDATVEALEADPRVLRVSVQRRVYALGSQSGATWGLDRVDQRSLPLDSTYRYNHTGAGVTAYIIDTGIRTDHEEFGGRASFGFDVWANDPANPDGLEDCHGHGTHVAGTVGGATYGVAKDVRLVAVRVLGCVGFGSDADVIAGMDWVAEHGTLPAVANMSLGDVIPSKTMGTSGEVDGALKALIASGVTVAVAAGNGWGNGGAAADACMFPFSNVAEALVVAASDASDRRTRWTNYGECVDFFAPGLRITSAWNASPTATRVASGTSMATPHTAGVAALVLEQAPGATPADVHRILYDASTKNVIQPHDLNSVEMTNTHLLFSRIKVTEELQAKTGPTVPCTPKRQREGQC